LYPADENLLSQSKIFSYADAVDEEGYVTLMEQQLVEILEGEPDPLATTDDGLVIMETAPTAADVMTSDGEPAAENAPTEGAVTMVAQEVVSEAEAAQESVTIATVVDTADVANAAVKLAQLEDGKAEIDPAAIESLVWGYPHDANIGAN
jgi:hypothetical protein